MFKAIGTLLKNAHEALQKRKMERARNLRLDKIRKFQRMYESGGDVVQAEFTYQILSESLLADKSLEELDALVERVTEGEKYVESAMREVQFRREAENPNHLFIIRFIAPRRSTWLEFSKASKHIPEVERHCLVLLRILFYYNYMEEPEYKGAAVAFLGSPAVKYADPARGSRNYESELEIMDKPFIHMILSGRETPKSYGFEGCQKAFNEQLKKNPQSRRLYRLKTEFQAKGVLTA